MKAIILNAGAGKRLLPITANTHKCLLEVGELSILEHQLSCLIKVGVKDVIIVLGAKKAKVEDYLRNLSYKINIQTVFNPFYSITENIVSLWLAKNYINGDLFIMMGDLVFDSMILKKINENCSFCNLAVQKKTSYQPDDMKVMTKGKGVTAISKDIKTADAEYLQISYYNRTASDVLRKVLDEILEKERFYGWYPEAIQELIHSGNKISAVDCTDFDWIEIDSKKDLSKARKAMQGRR